MNTTHTIINNTEQPDKLFLESDWNNLPDLNTPVLIVLKTDQVGSEEFALMEGSLSEQEMAKSRRFRFPRDRKSYIVVHGFLRLMVGKYLGLSPEILAFNYSLKGKPSISGYSRKIFFNLSHSSGVSVLAFDPDHEIGVDIEKIDEGFEYLPIVQHFFSKGEKQYIQRSEEDGVKRFYEIWTRKEAYLKAVGKGITKELHVEVLKEKMKGNTASENGPEQMDLLFRTMIVENDFRITMAMCPDSAGIRTYFIRNNGIGLQIDEA
jgi:phosphopantetheine--protein transferase-like protein